MFKYQIKFNIIKFILEKAIILQYIEMHLKEGINKILKIRWWWYINE